MGESSVFIAYHISLIYKDYTNLILKNQLLDMRYRSSSNKFNKNENIGFMGGTGGFFRGSVL